MGLLDRAIKNSVNRAISGAVGSAVETGIRRTVAPKIEQATAKAVNSAADRMGLNQEQTAGYQSGGYQSGGYQSGGYQSGGAQSSYNSAEFNQAMNTLGGVFGGFSGAMTNFATQAAQNMKICPSCGEGASAENAFCPSCGAQNTPGTKFCASCGAKLPAAVAEERAGAERDAEFLANWEQKLPAFPRWSCGGSDYTLENMGTSENGVPNYYLYIRGGTYDMLRQYQSILRADGFVSPPNHNGDNTLYKIVNGISYVFSSVDAFGDDSSVIGLNFYSQSFKPKEEPRRRSGFGLRSFLDI